MEEFYTLPIWLQVITVIAGLMYLIYRWVIYWEILTNAFYEKHLTLGFRAVPGRYIAIFAASGLVTNLIAYHLAWGTPTTTSISKRVLSDLVLLLILIITKPVIKPADNVVPS